MLFSETARWRPGVQATMEDSELGSHGGECRCMLTSGPSALYSSLCETLSLRNESNDSMMVDSTNKSWRSCLCEAFDKVQGVQNKSISLHMGIELAICPLESRNATRIRITCRDEAELARVKEDAQKTAARGARDVRGRDTDR